MFNNLWLYMPILLLFLLDFAIFGHHQPANEPPDLWLARRGAYNVVLAGQREDANYGPG